MAASALALQWSLDRTTATAVDTLRGVLTAATTDNLQPIALLAAEAFGATLPMAEQSRMLVEKAASRRGYSPVLEHLKIKIGWAKNDSASWLTMSDAGIRFLGLATTLLTLEDTFTAARCLDRLIRDSAPSDTLLPTFGQLQDLLVALDPKLSSVDFGDKVLGAGLLTLALDLGRTRPERYSAWTLCSDNMPGVEHVIALVDAVKKFGRVCEIQQQGVGPVRLVVSTSVGCSWIYAFLQWIFGFPPSLVSRSSDEVLNLNSDANVLLIFDPSLTFHQGAGRIKIAIYENIAHPSQLWNPSDSHNSLAGRVSLEAFGQYMLTMLKAVHLTTTNEFFRILAIMLRRLITNATFGPEDAELKPLGLWPGASLEAAFIQVLQVVFGDAAAKAFTDTDRSKCLESGGRTSSTANTPEKTAVLTSFTGGICEIILALGFFDAMSLQTIKIDAHAVQHLDYDTDELRRLLEGRQTGLLISPEFIMGLVGTIVKRDEHSFRFNEGELACSDGGQVVYLAQLSAPRVRPNGMLSFSAVPGQICYRNETFRGIEPVGRGTGHAIPPFKNKVMKPENLCDNAQLQWAITRGDRGLYLTAGLEAPKEHGFETYLGLGDVQKLFYLPSCAHASDAPLPTEDANAVFVHPYWFADMESKTDDDRVFIAAVAHNDDHRYMAYACATSLGGSAQQSAAGVLFKGESCLACSLEFCRRKGIQHLIL